MKIKTLITTLTATTLLVGMVGCKKEDTQKAADNTKEAAGNLVDAVKAGTDKAVDKTKELAADAADKTKEVAAQAMDKAKEGAEAVKAEAQKLTTPAPADQAQSIIDQAKSLLDSGKLQEALTALEGLKGMTLSDAQQKIVAGLKEQIQKALADKAAAGAGAVGNLLGK